MASREEIEWAYRLFYDREPDTELAVTTKFHLSRQQLVEIILGSEEFKINHLSSTVPDRWLWCDCFGYQLRINLKDEHISRRIVENQYEIAETLYMQHTIRADRSCMDLGSNIGYFTLLMARLVGPNGRVISVEPDPSLFESLTIAIERNRLGKTTKLYKAAVSDTNGSARLLPPTDKTNWGQAHIDRSIAKSTDAGEVSVRTVRLDKLRLPRPIDFIKMDVEGAEGLVLSSSKNFLQVAHPTMLLEVNPVMLEKVSKASVADCFDVLNEMGYHIFGLEEGGRLGRRLQASDITGVQNVVATGPRSAS